VPEFPLGLPAALVLAVVVAAAFLALRHGRRAPARYPVI
jgi:hypothetical protein